MLNKTLSPHTERAYAVMRVVLGLLLAFHGMQKVFGILAEQAQMAKARPRHRP